jgi:hypothetical protein
VSPYLKKKKSQKRVGREAQDVDLELKPQYHQKKKRASLSQILAPITATETDPDCNPNHNPSS